MNSNTRFKNRPTTEPIPGTPPLPCLNSNISTETHAAASPNPPTAGTSSPSNGPSETPLTEAQKDARSKLKTPSTQNLKSAFVLQQSVAKLAQDYTLEHIGFLTLTFAQHITCPKRAQKRLNSLLTHIIKPRYREYLGVMERQKSGRIHYHMLIVLDQDIRTGFKFQEADQGNYSSANPKLRSEWAFWRNTAKKYGFGRTELLPVKSNIEAMAKYVGKYISKHIQARNPEDKGARLVRYSRGARAGTTRFQFLSPGSSEWRRKLATFAQIVQNDHPETQIAGIADLTRVLGKRWAYHHREFILNLP